MTDIYWQDEGIDEQWLDPPDFAGGASTMSEPQQQGVTDPGVFPEFGPNFVRFIHSRFAALETLMAQALDVLSRRPVEGQRFVRTGQTDGSGNATIIIFETEPGQKFVLHRCYIEAGGYTFGAPFTANGSYILLNVDDEPWDGVSTQSGSGQIPTVFTSGRLQAIEVHDGERLTVKILSGPVGRNIVCRCVGVLERVWQREP